MAGSIRSVKVGTPPSTATYVTTCRGHAVYLMALRLTPAHAAGLKSHMAYTGHLPRLRSSWPWASPSTPIVLAEPAWRTGGILRS